MERRCEARTQEVGNEKDSGEYGEKVKRGRMTNGRE